MYIPHTSKAKRLIVAWNKSPMNVIVKLDWHFFFPLNLCESMIFFSYSLVKLVARLFICKFNHVNRNPWESILKIQNQNHLAAISELNYTVLPPLIILAYWRLQTVCCYALTLCSYLVQLC